jgi:pilus assembly protein CpaC
MAARTSIGATALAVLIVSWIVPHAAAVAGNVSMTEPPTQTIRVVASDARSHSVTLGKGKSVVIDLPRDIKDVLVADPKIANAVIRSSRRAYIIGIENGATNIFFFDAEGKQIAGYDIAVARDVSVIQNAIQKLLCPRRDVRCEADVKVESIGDGIILKGTVANQAESQQAYDIASHFVALGDSFGGNSGAGSNGSSTGSPSGSVTSTMSTSSVKISGSTGAGGNLSKVVNAIVVRDRDEVMLKVTVAEMDRTVIKQLGINLNGSLGYGTSVVNFNNANPFPVNGALSTPNSFNQYGVPTNIPNSPAGITGTFKSVTANLQAMEQAGVVHTLAEPTLTAISGESAHFLAGGMFPYPSLSCTGSTCQPSIQFQNFGVGLTFSPVVLSEGRISLRMLTEVSELNNQNSVTLSGITVPGLSVRRADTTVEIPSGGTLAMAGMIQEQTKQTISGLPGLMEVPILGPLFKSRDYLNDRTELVVLVTPYIVRAVAEKDLSRPDDGFADPSDPAAVLLGRLNRIYGVGGRVDPPDRYHGRYGFILD